MHLSLGSGVRLESGSHPHLSPLPAACDRGLAPHVEIAVAGVRVRGEGAAVGPVEGAAAAHRQAEGEVLRREVRVDRVLQPARRAL
jgi:hypothetical protein